MASNPRTMRTTDDVEQAVIDQLIGVVNKKRSRAKSIGTNPRLIFMTGPKGVAMISDQADTGAPHEAMISWTFVGLPSGLATIHLKNRTCHLTAGKMDMNLVRGLTEMDMLPESNALYGFRERGKFTALVAASPALHGMSGDIIKQRERIGGTLRLFYPERGSIPPAVQQSNPAKSLSLFWGDLGRGKIVRLTDYMRQIGTMPCGTRDGQYLMEISHRDFSDKPYYQWDLSAKRPRHRKVANHMSTVYLCFSQT